MGDFEELDSAAGQGPAASVINSDIQRVPVSEIEPHPDNPRLGDVDAIKSSILRNGFYGALVVQESTGYILAGSHRYFAACELGFSELPVVWVECDPEEAHRILLADNKTADRADYDEDALNDLLESLADNDFELEGTGFEDSNLADMMLNERVPPDTGDDPTGAGENPSSDETDPTKRLDADPNPDPVVETLIVECDPDAVHVVETDIREFLDGYPNAKLRDRND